MSTTTLARVVAAGAVLALAVAAVPSAGAATNYDGRRGSAATWQAGQLHGTGRIPSSLGSGTDWGLTIDTEWQLAADGNHPKSIATVKSVLEQNLVSQYATSGSNVNAGAMAKTLLLSEVVGDSPTHFNGANLRQRVLDLVATSGFQAGRVEDKSSYDNSNVFSQSLAIIGLARSGSVPQSMVGFLMKQRCSNGRFRINESSDSTCDGDNSTGDPDATSMAIQALRAARGLAGDDVSLDDISQSIDWLVSQQKSDGGFGGGLGATGENANSTGLACQAFALANHPIALAHAQTYTAALQITAANAGSGPAKSSIGAVAYDKSALAAALKNGVTAQTGDQFRRTTPQASYCFDPVPLTTLEAPAA